MNVVIIGAGMGGLTTGIALKSLVTKSAFMSKRSKFFRLGPPFLSGPMASNA